MKNNYIKSERMLNVCLTYVYRMFIVFILLFTIGVGQSWATYYYRGGKNSWGATAMTDVNGIYSYYSASGSHQFKISTSTSSYDYNYSYVTAGYKQTDVSEIGDYGQDNCNCWKSGSHYILVFNPNTAVNSTNKPVICAATALPSAGFEETGNTMKYYSNFAAGDQTTSALDREDGSTVNLVSSGNCTSLFLKGFNTKMYQHYEVNLLGAENYHFYYKIHRTAVSPGSTGFTEITSASSYSAGSVTWGDWDGSKWRKPTYYVTADQNLLTGLGSGLYTMSYYFTHEGTTETYRLPSNSSKYNELKWKILPPAVSSSSCTSDGSGSGTDGSPFQIGVGSTLTLTVTGSQASSDANSVLYVSFDNGSTYSSTTTKSISITDATKRSLTIKVKYHNTDDNLDGSVTTVGTFYYQGTVTPSLNWAASNPISPTTAVAGENITLTVVRANSSANITYYYSTNSGSNWTSIETTSAQTCTFTTPANTGATQSYIFKAEMSDGGTKSTGNSSAATVYGKKTIKVKNTNNWGTMKLYLYSASAEKEDWPGSTTGITSAGGQWKTVVLTSEWPYFILNNDNNGSQIKGNKTYSYESSVTDGYCYVISEGTGDQLTLTYTANCPTAPTSITTSAATSLTNTTATINGSIGGNGNDNITDYGFYWGTSSTPGTKQAKGSSNYTGSISHGLTGLTAGTTYYYQAYATNGQGTTKSSPAASFVAPYKVTVSKSTGCSSITNSGVNYTSSTITVVATKTTGYTFSSWSTTNGTQTSTSSTSTTNTLTFTPSADLATIQPTYTENSYAVSVSVSPAATGSFSPTPSDGKITVKQVTGTNITANPATNYAFVSWTYSGGGLTSSSTTKTSNFKATGTGGSIQANFADKWNVKGSGTEMGSWSTYKGMPYAGSANTFSKTFSLPAKTTYSFKIVKRADAGGSDVWYGVNGGKTLTRAAGSVTGLKSGTGEGDNITFTTDAAGTYTITYVYNASEGSMSVSVGYPTAYTVQFGSDGHGTVTATATSAGGSMTSGDYVASGDVVTFAQTPNTGYTLKGWYTTAGGSTSAGLNGDNQLTINAAKTVYAQYNAKTYNITLDQQTDTAGYRASGSTSLTATYDAAFPSITTPTAQDGWAFMGYWSEARGKGTQFTDKDGALLADIENYSDASGHWKYDGTKTLYAYYKKAEITGITFSTAGVPGSVIAPSTSTTATATISPTPTGTTTICWRILHSNGNPLEEQPTFDPETGAAVSFTTSATSGSYLIEARLRLGSGCSGTVLDSVTAAFQVAGDHNVTVQYKDASGNTIKASETVTGRPLAWSDDITAPDIFGYTFAHWDAGDGVTIKNGDLDPVTTSTDATIKIKAIYDGRLTAVYNQKSIIYFKNTLEWGSVYVNFYGENGYWDDKGSGNKTVAGRNKEMTQIDGTDIWYFDYGAAGITATKWVSFTEDSQNGNGDGSQNFWKAGTGENVVYPARRGDDLADKATATGFYAKTPMFVPLETQTPKVKNSVNSGQANYYNDGYWTKYTPGTGYTLEIYDNYDASPTIKTIAFSGDGDLMPMTAVADLEAGKTYRFQLKRDADVYYGNNGTMTYANHGQDTPWEMSNEAKRRNDANTADVFAMCKINTTAAGNYTFHLTYSPNGSGVNRLRMAVDYPVAQGDYRLLYKDNVHTLWHPSAVIPSVKAKDTVSFFVRKGKTAYLKLQKCTGLGDGTVTWSDTVTWWNGSSLPAAVTKDSIYNICLKHNTSTGKLEIENVEGYSGNYYIRTDAANSKWDNYRSDPDHLMTYSEYSITHGGYSHYYCHWVTTADAYRKNVKFVIANDYSPCISDTLIRETVAGDWAKIDKLIDEYGTLLRSANVRFMWNIADNTIKRAYLDPAKNDDNFLVLSSADSKIANASEVVQTAVVFSDNENWIYEANVKAKPNAQIKLIATWGAGSDSIVQYFKGTSSTTETLITGSGDNWYNIRLIYDYKTNRLVSALLPSGNITTETPINADVMFIREHQGDIAQLTFSGSGSLTEIKTAYGVIRFNKWTLNNKEKTGSHTPLASPLSRYERDLFYISFPFRVNLNEVFGFGTYGVHWIIEEYDGAARAANGLWKDTPSYWRFITNRRGKYLEPNVGYLLALDLDELGESSSVWNNDVENVELFFPSCDGMSTITSSSVTHTLPSHECTINRPTPQGDRRISDSHWNIMSVPTYVNVNNPSFTNSTWKATIGPKFLYTWNADDNTLTPTTAAGFNYHAMHAYTVQYYGNVTWTTSVSPSSIVARKQTEPSAYEWCLELQQNDKMIDRTYVRMSDEEEVTTGFEFGYDMSKSIEWAKANIYTFIGTEWVAGNSLPLETEQTTIIPVGLTLAAAGDYTFAMPAGTHGVGVTLVDTQTNERTNLSAGMTQTVTLTQGDHLDRFFLEISPIHNTPTDIGEVTGNGLPANGARKVLIDGILYIVKGDKLYDVRGTMIK